jgi:lipopolysaccharide/colanic/teichoic acid biosynthesis glycosyltransferase
MDVVLCGAALVLLAPVMAAVALWVRCTSPGPILYRARRAGYKGEAFDLLKFRTMRLGADRDGAITEADDRRVLPGGRVVRLLRLDELPQIFNILRGEMSLVGPRPEDLDIVRTCYTPEQRAALDVLPGLSGIPQVSFLFDTADLDPGDLDPQEHYRQIILPLRLTLDLEYIRRQSVRYDLYLLARTFLCIAFKSWGLLMRDPRRNLHVEPFKLVTR